MALGVRQQGEIAYLRGALGLDDLEGRVAKLEGKDEYDGLTLEERDSAGKANLAKLDSYGATEFSPEGAPDPEDMKEPELAGVVNEDEALHETYPAVASNDLEPSSDDLDDLMLEEEEEK